MLISSLYQFYRDHFVFVIFNREPSHYRLAFTELHNEKELLLQVAEGDETAFNTLFQHYTAHLHPYIMSLVKSATIAEEMIQETFIRIWMNRDKLSKIEHPRAWIFRIAANECFNFLRHKLVEEKTVIKLRDW